MNSLLDDLSLNMNFRRNSSSLSTGTVDNCLRFILATCWTNESLNGFNDFVDGKNIFSARFVPCTTDTSSPINITDNPENNIENSIYIENSYSLIDIVWVWPYFENFSFVLTEIYLYSQKREWK